MFNGTLVLFSDANVPRPNVFGKVLGYAKLKNAFSCSSCQSIQRTSGFAQFTEKAGGSRLDHTSLFSHPGHYATPFEKQWFLVAVLGPGMRGCRTWIPAPSITSSSHLGRVTWLPRTSVSSSVEWER